MAKRISFKNLEKMIRTPFLGRTLGLGAGEGIQPPTGNPQPIDASWTNSYVQSAAFADDSETISLIGSDTENYAVLNGATLTPTWEPIALTLPLNAQAGNQAFFIAPRNMKIHGINISIGTLATVGSPTAIIEKLSSGQSSSHGTPAMTNTFALSTAGGATVNVVQQAILPNLTTAATGTTPTVPGSGTATNISGIRLTTGDRLGIVFTGTLTTLAGVTITLLVAPGNKSQYAVFNVNANASLVNASQNFFLGLLPYQVRSIAMTWSTPQTAALTLTVTKDTSTNAPGAGTTLLSAAQSVQGTANVPVFPALAATAATKLMAIGDRLSAKFSGNPSGQVAGVVIVVELAGPQSFNVQYGAVPLALIQPTLFLQTNANIQTAQCFFTADRYWILDEAGVVFATADGNAITGALTIDRTTTAPGGGTAATGNMALNGTAETPVFDAGAAVWHNRVLSPGDRLSWKASGAGNAALIGLTATAVLRPL